MKPTRPATTRIKGFLDIGGSNYNDTIGLIKTVELHQKNGENDHQSN